MIISLLLFTLCWMLAYFVAKLNYHKSDDALIASGRIDKSKMPIWAILLIASFCAFYNYYITTTGSSYGSDRENYLQSFEFGRFESIGLMFVMNFLHQYDASFNSLLYISTFISVAFVMLAYRYSRDANPHTVLLFFMSPYVFQTFTALKQCYTTAFATLLIMLLMQKKSLVKEVICIILIIVSCLFHSAGYLLIIIYALIRLDYKITNIPKALFYACVIVIFFKPLMLQIADLAFGFLPYLANKIYEYFGEKGMEAERGVIVVLKGLPYFYITFIAIKYRKKLRICVKDYDKYMLISLIGSIFYLATVYNVWMRRATDLLTFTIIVFWTQILNSVPNAKEKRVIEISLMLLFTYRWLIMIYLNFGTL